VGPFKVDLRFRANLIRRVSLPVPVATASANLTPTGWYGQPAYRIYIGVGVLIQATKTDQALGHHVPFKFKCSKAKMEQGPAGERTIMPKPQNDVTVPAVAGVVRMLGVAGLGCPAAAPGPLRRRGITKGYDRRAHAPRVPCGCTDTATGVGVPRGAATGVMRLARTAVGCCRRGLNPLGPALAPREGPEG
jgi:hypothetical protein